MLEPFKAVEVLKLSNCRAPMIRNSGTMPLLRTIIVSEYEYRQIDGQYGMFEEVYDLLTSRRRLGTPIEKVYIENCGLPPGAIERLERIAEVAWDGVEVPMCLLSDGGWPGMDSDTSDSDSSESTTSSDWIAEFDS
ncbi:hypothetical protein ONZ45_g15970 [Pleurotus djamor]|nr:hypothetical protein ONZ45_g15970 [Pleurotus djamor]